MSNRKTAITATVVTAGLLATLAACAPDPEAPAPTTTTGSNAPPANAPEGCEDYAVYGDLTGKTISVYTSIVEVEQVDQEESYDKFEECTGATIAYEGSREFEEQLQVRVASGSAPDIAYLPQPGLLRTLVTDFPGTVVAASPGTVENVDKFFSDSWKSYGTVDGTFYAAPLGANVKSLVWYNPSVFEDKGYEIPTTWDDLLALTDKITSDFEGTETKAWCAGIESGGATGWPATDWVEDVMLRTAGPAVYDEWVSHAIPFNDPQVVTALDAVGDILKDETRVNGGFGDVRTIATTSWGDAGLPILPEGDAAPKCVLHRAANFYQNNWPSGTEVAADGDVFAFYLPGKTADDKPVLGGGEFVTAFRDAPEVAAFQAFLASDTWANEKARVTEGGGWVSANTGLDVSLLATEFDQLSASILLDDSSVIRFDASDLMPAQVGAGSFWTEMVAFFAEGKSSQDVADAIESTWP